MWTRGMNIQYQSHTNSSVFSWTFCFSFAASKPISIDSRCNFSIYNTAEPGL